MQIEAAEGLQCGQHCPREELMGPFLLEPAAPKIAPRTLQLLSPLAFSRHSSTPDHLQLKMF